MEMNKTDFDNLNPDERFEAKQNAMMKKFPNNNEIEIDNKEDFDEDEFERKSDAMNELFPNLPFSPNTDDYDILDNVLVENTLAVIYIECNCHCFGRVGTTENEFRKPKKIITIKRKNRYITYRDFYSTMNRYKNWISCDHSFLEQLIIIDNLVIHMGFGS